MLNVVPDKYCPSGSIYSLAVPRVPAENFAGMRLNIEGLDIEGLDIGGSGIGARIKQLVTSMSRRGAQPDTIIMHPDQYAQLQAMLSAKKTEIDALYENMRESMGSYPTGGAAPTALAVGIAATCAIAGLGLLIARRNAVMAEEGPSEPWLKAFIEWACTYVRALFAPPPLALPAHEESDGN